MYRLVVVCHLCSSSCALTVTRDKKCQPAPSPHPHFLKFTNSGLSHAASARACTCAHTGSACSLTKQQHAGVGSPQTVGGEAGVVAKVFLRHVGKQQQRARLLVFDPQGVVILHRPGWRGGGVAVGREGGGVAEAREGSRKFERKNEKKKERVCDRKINKDKTTYHT